MNDNIKSEKEESISYTKTPQYSHTNFGQILPQLHAQTRKGYRTRNVNTLAYRTRQQANALKTIPFSLDNRSSTTRWFSARVGVQSTHRPAWDCVGGPCTRGPCIPGGCGRLSSCLSFVYNHLRWIFVLNCGLLFTRYVVNLLNSFHSISLSAQSNYYLI